MRLLQVKQTDKLGIQLKWDDGHESPISFKNLRDGCPCAGCKGETVLLRVYTPPAQDKDTPGRYELRSAVPIGSYAIKFSWADGHDLGIYTWEHLRALCECEQCLSLRKGA